MKKLLFLIIPIGLLYACDSQVKSESSQEYLDKGIEFYKSRELDSALYYYNLALETNPNFDEALFRRALVKEKQDDLAGANEDYLKAIQINPKPIYYNNLGINYAIEEKYEDAIIEYDKALAIDSNYVQAIFNKGITFHHLGRWNEACEYANKALELGLEIAVQYTSEYCE